ncbi:MAG: NAD(P)-dependent oxidoreductase [Alphaproteobacteria bacterium]
MKFKTLNLEPADYSPEAREIIETRSYLKDGPITRTSLKEDIGDYDCIIVRLGHKIDKDLLENAKKLKVIVSATTGLNHIDIEEAKSCGIVILSLKGETEFLETVTATAEHTIGLMLSLIRQTPQAYNSVMDGKWDRNLFKGHDLFGKTLGIIGYGRLGKIVAKYAAAFGMTVIAYDIQNINNDEPVESASLNSVLSQSDIITLHASYSPENEGFIDKSCFDKMKKGAVFINTARGEIIDEKALLEALETRHLSGAALDVISNEQDLLTVPISDNLLYKYACKHENLILTPHIGGATYDSMYKTEVFMAHKLVEFFDQTKTS